MFTLTFYHCDDNMLDIVRNLDTEKWGIKNMDIWLDNVMFELHNKARLDFYENGDLKLKPSHYEYEPEYWLIDAGSYGSLDIDVNN